jgi:beta-glucosidase
MPEQPKMIGKLERSHNVQLWLLLAMSIGLIGHAQRVPEASARQRAQQVVRKMTLTEKIARLHGVHTATEYRIVPGLSRLGIPPFRITNGPAGVGPGGAGPQLRATALPAPIALAATWDPEMALEFGSLGGKRQERLARICWRLRTSTSCACNQAAAHSRASAKIPG